MEAPRIRAHPESGDRELRLITEPLDPNEILIAEYNYIAQTAFQANEDRARVSTFYMVTLGSLVAAILSSQFITFNLPGAYWAFAVLFTLVSSIGILTLLQLVRLRQAWLDSALAMNQIKDFYIQNIRNVNLEGAFRWKAATLPKKYKLWSISFLLALQVALLGGVMLGSAVICIGLGFNKWWLEFAILAGGVFFVF